ncbi:mCG148099 [Mus musculus]|nr:mCG148099 [Mus musculus]
MFAKILTCVHLTLREKLQLWVRVRASFLILGSNVDQTLFLTLQWGKYLIPIMF